MSAACWDYILPEGGLQDIHASRFILIMGQHCRVVVREENLWFLSATLPLPKPISVSQLKDVAPIVGTHQGFLV
jgi:hypothetical protein